MRVLRRPAVWTFRLRIPWAVRLALAIALFLPAFPTAISAGDYSQGDAWNPPLTPGAPALAPSGAGQPMREWEVPLRELGEPDPMILYGLLSERPLSVPIPHGLRALELTGRLRSSPGLAGGRLEVHNGDRTLAWIPLSPGELPLHVGLHEGRIDRERLNLSFRLVPPREADPCMFPLTERVELEDLRVRLEGTPEPPHTIAAFWPPDLRSLVLLLPPEPSPDEATAALRLVAFGTRRAIGHPLTVSIRLDGDLLPLDPWDPWTRVVQIKRGEPRTGLRFPEEGFPTLEIQAPSGTADRIVESILRYGEALPFSEVAPQPGATPEAPFPRRITLAELGHPQVQMSGSGPMEFSFFFSQGDLGGPVRGVRFRLVGRMSPVPEGGRASLLVFLNGGLAHAEPIGGGAFDRWIAFPDGLLQRDNTLIIRVDYTPPGGDCRIGMHPLTVFMDGASYLEFQAGRSLGPGFERFPQALLPAFIVGLHPLDESTLNAAAQLVMLLQRATRRPLQPEVRPWEQALSAGMPRVLITRDPEAIKDLRPPLDPRPFRLLDLDGRERFRMDPDRPFIVLEAFEHGGHDLLLLTRWGQTPELHTIASAFDPQLGWYGLSGDVWIWPAGESPVEIRVRGAGLRVEPLPSSPAVWWSRLWPWALGAAFLGLLVFLIWVYPRVVRTRPPGPALPAS
ncbi:hypothetical protein HRbin22_02125 [Candidatus Thermoflexus japonica]|uniref:Uncharacterized protein n=1 Tax=Candidatus Thermoflexus japonica TaxID=2035417 RepID=A0A2H5Y8X7_9CHLR|nr:hypothetical protein HRbin22_02125 [Candidatus Thermoflexus japonica]